METATAPAPASEKKKRHLLRWIVIGFVAIMIIGAVSGGGDDATSQSTADPASSFDDTEFGSGTAENPATEDVELSTCTGDEYSVKAGGTITNHSSKASNYSIEVEFVYESGTRFADGLDFQTNIAPGQSSNWEALDMPSSMPTGPFTCRIVEVDRTAA